jgi:DNA-binding LacI/PurR family transcriptional regulator
MPSRKRITSQDVANEAGVSRTTVSLVLNDVPDAQISEVTRQRVITAARKLAYVPDAAARALVSGRAQIIGLMLIRRPYHIASDGFLTQILDGLLEDVHRSGLRLLFDIIEPEHQIEAYLNLVRSKHIDGIILFGPRFDDEALDALEKDGIPLVLIGQLPGSNICSVDIDNFKASREAVRHLINLGHSHIACITNASPTYTAAADRLAGYTQALADAGIPYDENLVRYGDFTMRSGYEQMQSLFASKVEFSAVFVASDEIAIGAKAAIYAHNLDIPHDIALVGFDDLPIARYLEPPLTTVSVPAINIAQKASTMLISTLRGEEVKERRVILEAPLIIRESCGAQLR